MQSEIMVFQTYLAGWIPRFLGMGEGLDMLTDDTHSGSDKAFLLRGEGLDGGFMPKPVELSVYG